MKKTRRIFSVICAIALLLGSATTAFAGELMVISPNPMATEEPVAVIYYTNDIHGAYENMAKVAYLAETEVSACKRIYISISKRSPIYSRIQQPKNFNLSAEGK